MSTVTTLLGLTKPAGIEQFSLATYNNNLDLVDAEAVNLRKSGLGRVARVVQNGADATGISTITVLQNIATFSFKGGRAYTIRFVANYYVSNTDTVLLVKISTCSTSDAGNLTTGLTIVNQTDFMATQTNRGFNAGFDAPYEPVSDTTLQVKVTAERVSGTGTISLQRSAVTPNFFMIVDEGDQI